MLRALVILYAIALVAILVLLYPLGDRFWASTPLLLGPRWVLAVPWPTLVLGALLRERRLLLVLAPLGLVLLVPILGFRAPLRWPPFPEPDVRDLRVMSYNMGGGRFDPFALQVVLETALPDVVALQECGERMVAGLQGWVVSAQFGSCLLSRMPIGEVAARPIKDIWKMAGSGVVVRYSLETPAGTVHLANVHLETPREGLEELLGSLRSGVRVLESKNGQREIEARLARRWADESPGPARIVAGDFNMTVESDVFRTYWSGYQDAFSVAGLGLGFTKHTRLIAARIDHILAGPGWLCVKAWVGPSLGQDHRPVFAVLRWVGPKLRSGHVSGPQTLMVGKPRRPPRR